MVVTLGMGRAIHAHNIPPGMNDPKAVSDNVAVITSAIILLERLDRILHALAINPERALEELNSDWTASQEVADVLMRKYRLPFRIGHHFASDLVDYAKAKNIRPSAFPYAEARRIYAAAVEGYSTEPLPMSEAEFRATLDPVAIIRQRATVGGPQPAEMERMLGAADKSLAQQGEWVRDRRAAIASSLARLDHDFDKLLKQR